MAKFDDTLKSKEWLIYQYVDLDKTADQISKDINCSDTTVAKYLKSHGIKLKSKSNYEYIRESLSLGKSVGEISSEVSLHPATINRIMVKSDLKLLHRKYLNDRDWLTEAYQNLSTYEIADKLHCSRPTVSDALKKHNIPIIDYSVSSDIANKFSNLEWLKSELKTKGIRQIARECGCTMSYVQRIITENAILNLKSNTSIYEYEISKWLTTLPVEFIQSDRTTIPPYELDFYLPKHNIAIEFNGLYWHSHKFKDNQYHLRKTKLCEDNNIQLIHIFEDDWLYRQNQVKSMIVSKLGINSGPRIYARNCTIIKGKSVDFYDYNHIQGNTGTTVDYKLVHNGDIVAQMGFKIRTGTVYELVRYCTSTRVIGGAGKLLKAFIREYNPSEIISFADKTVSNGDMYYKLGFVFDRCLPPDYKYIVGDKRKHKFGFRKPMFKRNPNLKYLDGLTEFELAKMNNINRIYDCGKMRFILKPLYQDSCSW